MNLFFFKQGSAWVFGSTSKSFMPAGRFFLSNITAASVNITPLDRHTYLDSYQNILVASIKKNQAGDTYASMSEFITAVADFFVPAAEDVNKNIKGLWRHGFGGTALNPAYFEVLQTGIGQTVRVGQVNREGTWTRSTTTATATVVAHGLVTGDLITILYTPDELAIIYSTVLVTVTGVDTFTFSCLNAGAANGIFAYGQDISNLQLLSGVTPNSETIIKSACTFTGTLDMTFGLHMSQRIANCELSVGLYEVSENEVGRPCTISGQIATVTEENHGHLQGQELQILTSSDGSILTTSVRIISVPTPNTFTFACLGGVGATSNITYFAYDSAIEIKYNGTSATNARISTFRNVWDSPAPTTISSTAGLPNVYKFQVRRGNITYGDYAPNSTSGTSTRSERNKEIPDVLGANFYVFIRLKNLAVAPASNTTCTFSFFEVNQNTSEMVEMASAGMASALAALGVNVLSMPSSTSVAIGSPSTSSGGLTLFHVINSAASTNLTSVKTSGAALGNISLHNNGASVAYFKLYNKSSAPVLASDVPSIGIYAIPPGQSRDITFGTNNPRPSSGLAYAIVGGVGNTDATAVAAGQVTGMISYA